ncbi:hypothetical protein [Streptomyces globisporus]|uniref:hypothetical protein n=1 Tax=Streptomyces globisporus TaxID=1908 RepID=UPI00380D5B2A
MAAPLMAKRWTIRHCTGSDPDGARTAMQGAKAFRGTGAQLQELLAISAFGAGNDPASALDTAIGGAFELKVPDGLPVAEWHKK